MRFTSILMASLLFVFVQNSRAEPVRLSADELIFILGLQNMETGTRIHSLNGPLDWSVGDRAEYRLSAGLVSGRAVAVVRDDLGTEYRTEIVADAGVFGRYRVETFFVKATGEIRRVLIDGKEQKLPSPSDLQVIERKTVRLRVPAAHLTANMQGSGTTRPVNYRRRGSIQKRYLLRALFEAFRRRQRVGSRIR